MLLRKISALLSTVALAATGFIVVAPNAGVAGAAPQTYNTTTTFNYGNPAIPSLDKLPSGADAATAIFGPTAVFLMDHGNVMIDCHLRSDSSKCDETNYPYHVTHDGFNVGSGMPNGWYDESTKHVYFGGIYNDGSQTHIGVACVDVSTLGNPSDCGFTDLYTSATVSNDAWNSVAWTGQNGDLFVVGTDSATYMDVVCFDPSTMQACTYPVTHLSDAGYPLGNKYKAPDENMSFPNYFDHYLFMPDGDGAIHCVDLSTAAACNVSGVTWPLASGTFDLGTFSGSDPTYTGIINTPEVYPHLTNGIVDGFCYFAANNTPKCLGFDGSPKTAPTGMSVLFTPVLNDWSGDGSGTYGLTFPGNSLAPVTIYGSRIYQSDTGLNANIYCFDFSTNAACANFPANFPLAAYQYVGIPDTYNQGCFWAIADGQGGQLENGTPTVPVSAFDPYTGGQCSSGTVAPINLFADGCQLNDAVTLLITDPASVTGTVIVRDAAGNTTATKTIQNNSISLSGTSMNQSSQFVVQLTSPASPATVTASLNWSGPACPQLAQAKPKLYVVPSAKSVAYGANAPAYTFKYYSNAGRTVEVHPTLATAPTCGSSYTKTTSVTASPLTVSCGGQTAGTAGSDPNYTFVYDTAQLTITKADQAAAHLDSGTQAPNGNIPLDGHGGSSGLAPEYRLTGGTASGCAIVPGTPVTVTATSTGTCVVELVIPGGDNFNDVTLSGTTFTFANLPSLYVVPTAKSVTYGAAAPSYTFKYYSDANHTIEVHPTLATAPTCGSSYTNTTSVTASPLTISCGGDPAGTAGNDSSYILVYATANLTINKADQKRPTLSPKRAKPGDSLIVHINGGTNTGATQVWTLTGGTATECTATLSLGWIVTASSAGTCVYSLLLQGGDNYNDLTLNSQTFTFSNQVTPVTIRVHFDSASIYVKGAGATRLRNFVRAALQAGAKHLTVVGFADPNGNTTFNNWLSTNRAQRVTRILRAAIRQHGASLPVTPLGNGIAKGNGTDASKRYVEVTLS